RRMSTRTGRLVGGRLDRCRIGHLELSHGANLDASDASRGNLRCNTNRMVEITRFDKIEAGQLLFGLRERSVCHGDGSVVNTNRGGRRDGMEGLAPKSNALLEEGVAERLAFGVVDDGECRFIGVDETYVLHWKSSIDEWGLGVSL